MLPALELEPTAIRAAHATIPSVFRDTPQYVHDGLSARLGVPVAVKVETANPIRSFKGRGTWVALSSLASAGAVSTARPVVCASAGNFGQGVAWAARALGVVATVFVALSANPAKVARMRALGAEVVEVDGDFDDARAASEAHVRDGRAHLLVDGDDTRVSTGAATLALELTDGVGTGALPSPAVASVPVGNGALIVGVGSWLRAAAPACRVVGVQAEGAAAMTLSWGAGRPIDTPAAATYADGTVYKGGFVDGQREGQGEIVMPDGFRYSGGWKQGQIDGIEAPDESFTTPTIANRLANTTATLEMASSRAPARRHSQTTRTTAVGAPCSAPGDSPGEPYAGPRSFYRPAPSAPQHGRGRRGMFGRLGGR